MTTLYVNGRWWETGELQQMRVRDGRVLDRAAETLTESDRVVDMGGKTLRPALIDSHCHILPTGLDLQKLNLAPFNTPGEVLEALRERNAVEPPEKWLRAVWYDQNRFPGAAHLHRDQLDAISSTRPIILRHANGHASVANTAALQGAGIKEDEPNPANGEFVRDAAGRMTGVLLEGAHERVFDSGPKVTFEEMVDAILAAGEKMAELGICAASDMMTGRYDLDAELRAYTEAARRGCKVRTRLYLQYKTAFGPRALDAARLKELMADMDPEHTRVAGIKIFADGAIGSRTAGIYGSFAGDPPAERSGQMMYTPERLIEMVKTADAAGYQVCVHSIGDYATDCVMNAFAATPEPSKHRIEHAMLLSDAQIERLAQLGCYVTMQPEFLHHFGASYRRNLRDERAFRLNRYRSVKDAGLRLSLNSDRPIVPGDPAVGLAAAVQRPEGFDQAENITPNEAFHGYTSEAADVNGDHGLMGRLEPGELALFSLA